MSSLVNFVKDSSVAKSLTDFSGTLQAGAEGLFKAGMEDIRAGKMKTMEQVRAFGSMLNDFSNLTPREMAARVKTDADGAVGYFLDSSPKQMASDIANSGAGQKVQQGYNWGTAKGNSILGDLDAFYHNADGSYDRTKVGLTAAGGLGIAGIAGYNMNN